MLYYFRCCQRRHKQKRISESFSASEKIDTQDTNDSWSPKNEDDLDAGLRDSEVCQGEQGTSTPSAQTSSETAVSQYSLVSDVHLSHVDLLQACQSFREPAYPLPAADVITHPTLQGLPAEETLVCPHTAENARGAVIFLPGVHGGVGPGRTPGFNFDENAIFPTIATMLRVEGISSYRISWKYMMPSLQQATGATFAAYLHYKPSRIVLVGHSLGGAVAYLAAKMLHRGGVDVVGVCSLAAQFSGAADVVADLSMEKLFIHGSDDVVLPVRCCEQLHALAAEPKHQHVVHGAEHDFFHHKHIVEPLICNFIRRCL